MRLTFHGLRARAAAEPAPPPALTLPPPTVVRINVRPLGARLLSKMMEIVPVLATLPPADLAAISGQGSLAPVLDAAGVNPDGATYTVEQNDYPVKIAGKLGQPQTWASAKRLIDHNVGRPRKPGSTSTFQKGSDGNFVSLYAGDVLSIPPEWRSAPAPAPQPPTAPTVPTWPETPPAGPTYPIPVPSQPFPQPPPGMPMPGTPMPPAPQPSGGVVTISDVQTVKQVQAHLATWGQITKQIVPADFGKFAADFDGALVPYSRTKTALASYQSWATTTKGHPLRKDGELDVPTYLSLSGTVQELLSQKPQQGGASPGGAKPTAGSGGSVGLLAAAGLAAALLLR